MSHYLTVFPRSEHFDLRVHVPAKPEDEDEDGRSAWPIALDIRDAADSYITAFFHDRDELRHQLRQALTDLDGDDAPRLAEMDAAMLNRPPEVPVEAWVPAAEPVDVPF